ncbi:MAG: helix-turn-helix domain-containing protein [Turicibacter sanguinis]|uniref:helix-turn-helix domain-containing protein n=1 Tax=Turicibacter sanguinis TaxID=154288 RepID=UPI003995AB5A
MSKIKKILIEKGIKQGELAKLVGVSAQTISDFINGKHDVASRTLYKIAKVLNVSMEELIEEENECKML